VYKRIKEAIEKRKNACQKSNIKPVGGIASFFKKCLKRLMKAMIITTIISIVVLLGAGIFDFVESYNAKEPIAKAKVQISMGQIEEAKETLKDYGGAQGFLRELSLVENPPEALAKMSGEDFVKLKNGHDVEILSDADLNSLLLNNIRKIEDLDKARRDYFEAEKQAAIEKAEAKKQADIERAESERRAAISARVKAYFHPLDNSHMMLEKVIKENLKDPNSYEHIETQRWVDYETGIMTVRTRIRANNSFGGKTVGTYQITQGIESGKILSFESLDN